MSNHETYDGAVLRTAQRNVHLEALIGVVDRLRRLEKESAVLAAEVMNLATQLRESDVSPAVAPKAYTIEQVGEAIGMKKSTVYAMINSGELPSFKRDRGARRVLIADLDRYLEELRDKTMREQSSDD